MPGACRPCGMWRTSRAVKISGEGNRESQIVLLGEGLGETEEKLFRPFVGRAGWQLNKCLFEAGAHRDEYWITNSVRCRPTNPIGKNRAPTTEEAGYCRGWLDDEMATLPNVKVIVALGATATWAALEPNQPRGGVLENQGRVFWSERYKCWVVCTLHPAYILRKPGEGFWLTMDLMTAKRLAETGTLPEGKVADIRVARTVGDVEALRDYLRRQQKFAFDWETDGLHLTKARGFMSSYCAEDNIGYVVPRYGASFRPLWSRTDLHRVDDLTREIMLLAVPKVGQNVPFDMAVTKTTLDVWPAAIEDDIMIKHHIVHNHLGERAHGLKRMSVMYTPYGRYDDKLDEWLVANGYTKDGKPDMGYAWKAPDDLVHQYGGTDSVVTMYLDPITAQQVQEAGLEAAYRHRLKFHLNYAYRDRRGLRIHSGRLEQLGQELGLMMDLTSNRLAQITGNAQFNPNSHDQVRKLLFDDAGLPILGLTDSGLPSTKEEYLIQVEDQHEAVPLILHYRTYSKMKGTFVDGRKDAPGGIKAAVDEDGRVRMNTLFAAVETFRLATRKPFPVHTLPRPLVMWSCTEGHGHYLVDKCCDHATKVTMNIRSLVIPEDGHRIVAADYVQQEYAIMAIAAGQQDMEEAMLDRGEDAHEFVINLLAPKTKKDFGHEVNGKWLWHSETAEAQYKNLRADYKRVNFLMMYLGGAKKLARTLTGKDPITNELRVVTEEEAAGIIETYYARLPDVSRWQYQTKKYLRKHGRVVGLFDTYRVLPGIFSPDSYDQFQAERAGCNFPIQNGGYHVLERGVNALDDYWAGNLPLKAPFPGRVLFTVHDETVAEVRDDLVEQARADMELCLGQPHDELVGACGIRRGIKVDSKVSDAWGDYHDTERDERKALLAP